MAGGRKTSFVIRLTLAERRTLLAWQRSTSLPAGLARRGRILLLLADRVPISHIAVMVGVSRRFVYKWTQRFLLAGLAGLADTPRRDSRRVWCQGGDPGSAQGSSAPRGTVPGQRHTGLAMLLSQGQNRQPLVPEGAPLAPD